MIYNLHLSKFLARESIENETIDDLNPVVQNKIWEYIFTKINPKYT